MILGIDYSLSSPSLCVGNGDFEECKFYILGKPSKDLDHLSSFRNITVGELSTVYENELERYEQIAFFFLDQITKYEVDYINIENYAYGAKGRVFNIAEHTGLLKYYLWKHDYKINLLEPTVVKKFAYGKGNASKVQMNEAFEKWSGTMILRDKKRIGQSPYSDIIDSWFISKYVNTYI